MEQQLIDVLERTESPDDIDDISKAMIMSRVTDILIQVRELTQRYLKGIEAIQKEHAIELKLSGLTVVLNVTDDVASSVLKGPTQSCVLGSRDKVLKNIAQIMEIL